ncbi:hypothetical protein N8T08_008815 [Aspergillus melleus]|uniref:Uncharacterized protein n=1 Tax=Aspergillus melleus TaxID=138277 RepID=A0ACC3AW96_9EURO|nr:hypothetical protein N8T08_008815 [Aspergillus melleus]
MDFQRRLVVGLDYGTTYSGICYSHQGKPHVVKEWPSFVRRPITASKTPSRIAYPDNDTRSQPLWGYQIPPTMPAISWTKLFLVNEEFTPAGEDLPWAYAVGIGNEPQGMRPIHVVQEYLAQLYRYLESLLQKKNISLDSIPLTVAVAVPAVWPEDSRTKLGFAVSRAGFGFGGLPRADVRLLTEPEAALTATLERRVEKGGYVVLHEGDRVIICDCGGGTVDLASFIVTRKSPLEYNELSPSTGEFCGSTAIDRMFYRFLVEKLGEEFLQIPRYLIAPGSSLMKWFENIKYKYNGIPRGVVYRTQIYQHGFLDISVTIFISGLSRQFGAFARS